MSTTVEDIRGWLENGKKLNASHVIVVCDTFSYEDYPVYVFSHENIREKCSKYNGVDMQSIQEVYNLSLDFDTQLNEYRSFNY